MTETLNIFRATEEILRVLTEEYFVNNMPKLWRHLLYPHLLDIVLTMHSLIHDANTLVDERDVYLKRYLGELGKLKSLTRVAHERRIFTHGQNDNLCQLYESVEKQATAWKKKTIQNKSKN